VRAFLLPAVIFVATQISVGASAQPSSGLEISSSGKLRVALVTNNILFTKKSNGRIVGGAVDLGEFYRPQARHHVRADRLRQSGIVHEQLRTLPNGTRKLDLMSSGLSFAVRRDASQTGSRS
jgi:hypothetical protein